MRVPIVALMLVAAGCASQRAATVDPEITIVQTSSISPAATQVTGAISVEYAMKVKNTLDHAITLRRLDMVSQGYGAYTLQPMSTPFDIPIEPGNSTTVRVVAPAHIDIASMIGANGPVTLRATVQFASPAGGFRTIVVQNVHTQTGLGQ